MLADPHQRKRRCETSLFFEDPALKRIRFSVAGFVENGEEQQSGSHDDFDSKQAPRFLPAGSTAKASSVRWVTPGTGQCGIEKEQRISTPPDAPTAPNVKQAVSSSDGASSEPFGSSAFEDSLSGTLHELQIVRHPTAALATRPVDATPPTRWDPQSLAPPPRIEPIREVAHSNEVNRRETQEVEEQTGETRNDDDETIRRNLFHSFPFLDGVYSRTNTRSKLFLVGVLIPTLLAAAAAWAFPSSPTLLQQQQTVPKLTLRDVLTDEQQRGFHLAMAPSFFGFYGYLGALAAWYETIGTIPPTMRSVSGASAGAMTAVLVAAGIEPQKAMEWCHKLVLDQFADGALEAKGDDFENMLHNLLAESSKHTPTLLEEAVIPVTMSVYDLSTSRRITLREGSMARAVRSSSTFSFRFQPVEWKNSTHELKFIDGGVVDKYGMMGLSETLPISTSNRVINLSVGAFAGQRPPGPSFFVSQTTGDTEVLSISLEGLPKAGPQSLKDGPLAFAAAREAMLQALDTPLQPVLEVGNTHVRPNHFQLSIRSKPKLTLRDVLMDDQRGFHLAMAPAFFGFYGYFGALAAWYETTGPTKPPIRSVTGASAGAMAAVLLAAGIAPQTAAEFCATVTLDQFADFPGYGALFKGDKFESMMETFLLAEGKSPPLLEEAIIPATVSAFDLRRLRGTILQQGSMARAARSSATFPLLFQPVSWKNSTHEFTFIDGGIADMYGLMGLSETLDSFVPNRVINLSVGAFVGSRPPGPSFFTGRKVGTTDVFSVSLEGLPKPGPFALENGPLAYAAARKAMLQALDTPMEPVFEAGNSHPNHFQLSIQVSGNQDT